LLFWQKGGIQEVGASILQTVLFQKFKEAKFLGLVLLPRFGEIDYPALEITSGR